MFTVRHEYHFLMGLGPLSHWPSRSAGFSDGLCRSYGVRYVTLSCGHPQVLEGLLLVS